MRVLIVDGYNALNATDTGRDLLRVDQEGARLHLIHQLSEFAVADAADVTVVFDAHGAIGATSQQVVDGVTVRFGSRRQSADHIIERLVFDLRSRGVRDVVVATNDRLIGDVVAPMGAAVVTVAKLYEEMGHARTDTPRRPPGTGGPARLEDGVDADVREQLERMRRGVQDEAPGT